jgi:glycosyltransferase involved in cell wall biosynthesis
MPVYWWRRETFRRLPAALTRPGRTEELSERGRRRARSEYSWDRVAEKMVRMYDRVLASS